MILNTALNPWADADLDSGFPLEHIIDQVRWCQEGMGDRTLSERRVDRVESSEVAN